MKYLFLLFFFFTTSHSLRAQEYDYTDSVGRKKLNSLINRIFSDSLKRRNYILFSIADSRYLFIVEKQRSYEEYYLNENVDTSLKKMQIVKIKKPNKMLAMVFDEKLYHKEYINLKTNFFQGKSVFFAGLDTYFYFMKDGKKIGEANLAMVIRPNPINRDISRYLFLTELKMYNSSIKR